MKLTTYFRAMERAQEVGKFITSYHLRAGLIRRMEARDNSHKVLNDYIFARDALDDMKAEVKE